MAWHWQQTRSTSAASTVSGEAIDGLHRSPIRGRISLHLGRRFSPPSPDMTSGPASGRATRLSRGTSGATSLATCASGLASAGGRLSTTASLPINSFGVESGVHLARDTRTPYPADLQPHRRHPGNRCRSHPRWSSRLPLDWTCIDCPCSQPGRTHRLEPATVCPGSHKPWQELRARRPKAENGKDESEARHRLRAGYPPLSANAHCLMKARPRDFPRFERPARLFVPTQRQDNSIIIHRPGTVWFARRRTTSAAQNRE